MKKVVFFILVFPCLLFAQQKGATPIPHSVPSTRDTPHSIRAVVVGISDYQHNALPDLQYADKDALAFAGWLAAENGWRVPSDSIQLLLNGQATAGKVINALGWLVESSGENDLSVIYFSGHGDIEKITYRQNGYLLCYDAPATTYPAGGCVPLGFLQDVVSTISDKKGRVVLVTDACHAGKLAGSAVNGTQTTNAALAKQLATEVKIMSCQADELALEGEQWGGGRGVFSFYLVDGLHGLADKNKDGAVTLLEIDRYLGDHVAEDVAPHLQNPVSLGDKTFVLARIEVKGSTQPSAKSVFQKTEIRGFFGSGEDSLLYRKFLAALERGDFLEPAGDCAEFYYQKLLQNPALGSLHNILRRNYAAALQDETQQAINALLDNDPYEANNWQYHPEKYRSYPDYLKRAIELLGEKHYMYSSLMSKKQYFEGYNLVKVSAAQEHRSTYHLELRENAKQHYLEAIRYDPDAAYLYYAIGDMYFVNNPYQTDSLILWCSRAADASPGWVTPLLRISDELVNAQGRMEESETWVRRALDILPNSYQVQEKLGFLYYYSGRRDEAFAVAQKMIAEKPDLFNAYTLMVFIHYFLDGDYAAAESYAEESVERNPSPNNWALNFWAGSQVHLHPVPAAIDRIQRGMEGSTGVERGYRGAFLVEALSLAGRYEEAETLAQQLLAESLPPFIQSYILYYLGKMRVRQHRLQEAAACFLRSLELDPTPDPVFITDYAWLGEIARQQQQLPLAENYFQKALEYRSGFGEDLIYREEALFLQGNYLLRQNRLAEAEVAFRQSQELRRKGFWGEYGFALLAAKNGNKQEALIWLGKALDNHYTDWESIKAEPLFNKLRNSKQFDELLAKYFPG